MVHVLLIPVLDSKFFYARLGWGGGGSGGSERLGRNERECRCSLSPGPDLSRLTCLRRSSPERGCRPSPFLGQLSFSVRLYLSESDIRRYSADALQDLVELTRFYVWRLLPPFVGRELLVIFFLLSFSFGTGFQSGVPFPLGLLFSVCHIGNFIPP